METCNAWSQQKEAPVDDLSYAAKRYPICVEDVVPPLADWPPVFMATNTYVSLEFTLNTAVPLCLLLKLAVESA